VRPAKLDWIRNEIARMRRAIRAQEGEIQMLKRAASAELLLARMWAKVDDLCRKREVLHQAQRPESGRQRITSQEA